MDKPAPKSKQEIKMRHILKAAQTTGQERTCFIIIVEEGNAERFPFAPAAKSKAASPQALPTQRVNIGGFT